jgi:hypothetical protein
MVMQKKTWMTIFLFKEFKGFFKRIIDQDLLILNGHGSHVTLKAIEQTHAFILNMVTLQTIFQMHYNFYKCIVSKPFKTTFRKERDNAMIKNKYLKLNKIKLTTWVDPTLDKGLFKKISNLNLRLQ